MHDVVNRRFVDDRVTLSVLRIQPCWVFDQRDPINLRKPDRFGSMRLASLAFVA
jgi:hypothetical protein